MVSRRCCELCRGGCSERCREGCSDWCGVVLMSTLQYTLNKN